MNINTTKFKVKSKVHNGADTYYSKEEYERNMRKRFSQKEVDQITNGTHPELELTISGGN